MYSDRVKHTQFYISKITLKILYLNKVKPLKNDWDCERVNVLKKVLLFKVSTF